MRWTSWYPAQVGDRRTSSWFAWWPVRIGNDVRWLETVAVEWGYARLMRFPCQAYCGWVKRRFVNDKQE